MIDEKMFEYKRYIQEHLRAIDDLEERKFAKMILGEGLEKIFEYSELKYQQLEERVWDDLTIPWNHYNVATTIIDRAAYDPIEEHFFPVCITDVKKKHNSTVYLEANDGLCNALLGINYMIGKRKQNGEEIKFKIEKCQRYRISLENLYQLFISNKVPWNTVHTGHLERFFDLIPISDTDREYDLNDIEFQWNEFQSYVHYDMIPLWNINHFIYQSQKFMVPCVDEINYEHIINMEDNKGYLVEVHDDILEVRYSNHGLIIKSRKEITDTLKIYQINKLDTDVSVNYSYPLLTNIKKDNFSGRYLFKTGNFIQTQAELIRKLQEMTGDYEMTILGCEIADQVYSHSIQADMNTFIREEIFPLERRRILVVKFYEPKEKNYLYESQIRYMLSQLQTEYFEYKCVGVFESE